MNFAEFIRTVPDHPKPGVLFRDVTTLFQHPAVFGDAITVLAGVFRTKRIDAVAGIEARGFIVGAPLAMALGVGFLTLRKPGKLPA
ncbi:MAG: adenine phosphoribosyltransferase, partial [Actinomycetota bacterium]